MYTTPQNLTDFIHNMHQHVTIFIHNIVMYITVAEVRQTGHKAIDMYKW